MVLGLGTNNHGFWGQVEKCVEVYVSRNAVTNVHYPRRCALAAEIVRIGKPHHSKVNTTLAYDMGNTIGPKLSIVFIFEQLN